LDETNQMAWSKVDFKRAEKNQINKNQVGWTQAEKVQIMSDQVQRRYLYKDDLALTTQQ
jgi:hypothetical protein